MRPPRNRRRPYIHLAGDTMTGGTRIGSFTQGNTTGVAWNTTSDDGRLIAPWRLVVARAALRGGDALFQLAKWIIR